MKVFQIVGGKCHWDATSQFPSVESTKGYFPESDLFLSAPDEVQEGWFYDAVTKTFFAPPEIKDDPSRYTDMQLLGQQITDLELLVLDTLARESGGGGVTPSKTVAAQGIEAVALIMKDGRVALLDGGALA